MLCDLAGNMFNGASYAAAVLALLTGLPQQLTIHDESSDDDFAEYIQYQVADQGGMVVEDDDEIDFSKAASSM